MVSKKQMAAQLQQLQGAEWDSDSESETKGTASSSFDAGSDLVHVPTLAEIGASDGNAGTKKRKSKMQRRRDAVAQRKQGEQAKTTTKQASRVLYLGRIPHGFYEKQMMGFFKQFGIVRRVRLSRNKRTGNSKHYAFIEFAEPEVAAIVAQTMNQYRLFDHTLSCHVVPVDAVHDRMFVGANKVFKPLPRQAINRNRHNAYKSYEQMVINHKRLVSKERQKRKVLTTLGIDYEFPGYEAQLPATTQHITFT